jgi:hypothetical protein
MCETFFSSTIYESNPERIICIENKSDMTILFKVTNGYTLKTPRKTDKTLEIISYKKIVTRLKWKQALINTHYITSMVCLVLFIIMKMK